MVPEPAKQRLGHPERQCAEEERKLRIDLAAFYRVAAHYGWDDLTNTHISVRIPGPEHHFLLNPYDLMFEEITASSLVKIDLDGNVIDGSKYRINKAGFTIHSALHAAREETQCVAHFHTVAGIAVGAQRTGLLPISGHAMFLTGRIGFHDYAGAIIDEAEQPRLVRNLGSNVVMFLRNHGTIAVGRTIAEAFYYAHMLERACRIQIAATAPGGELVMGNQDIADHLQSQMSDNFEWIFDLTWDAQVRMMIRKDNGFRD